MDGTPTKRGRGRPRKTAPIPSIDVRQSIEDSLESSEETVQLQNGDDAGSFDLEKELEMAMSAPTEISVGQPTANINVREHHDDLPSGEYESAAAEKIQVSSEQSGNNPGKVKPVKKMSSTTRKMMKFGYSQLLRAAEPISKGRVPGEKMAYIINNDEQAEAILDEILTELDQKYKVEQYFSPESKLVMFTAQLFIQAKAIDETR